MAMRHPECLLGFPVSRDHSIIPGTAAPPPGAVFFCRGCGPRELIGAPIERRASAGFGRRVGSPVLQPTPFSQRRADSAYGVCADAAYTDLTWAQATRPAGKPLAHAAARQYTCWRPPSTGRHRTMLSADSSRGLGRRCVRAQALIWPRTVVAGEGFMERPAQMLLIEDD